MPQSNEELEQQIFEYIQNNLSIDIRQTTDYYSSGVDISLLLRDPDGKTHTLSRDSLTLRQLT